MKEKVGNNFKRSAEILATFDKTKATELWVDIYFYDRKARQIFLHQAKYDYSSSKDILSWDQLQWGNFILEGAEHCARYSKLSPDEALSIVLRFKTRDMPNATWYYIEASNIAVCGFNRILLRNQSSRLEELSLSSEEIQRIHSIDDVIYVVNEAVANGRLVEALSNMPLCRIMSPDDIAKNLI